MQGCTADLLWFVIEIQRKYYGERGYLRQYDMSLWRFDEAGLGGSSHAFRLHLSCQKEDSLQRQLTKIEDFMHVYYISNGEKSEKGESETDPQKPFRVHTVI